MYPGLPARGNALIDVGRSMNRFPRPSTTRLRARTGSRQTLVVVAIGTALALGALATGELVTAKGEKAAAAAGSSDDEIYTGSILYMPDDGNICRQLLFDNHNGQFTDNGYVDCMSAAYHGAIDTPKQWSAARLRVISTGFRQR
jgi:hypothetical protein